MPYYGDGLPYYYGGPFANHSSLMTGTPRGLHAPLSRFSPHLSTISESPLTNLRRYSPVTVTPRPKRVIDTADIDVSTPRILSRDGNRPRNRLRRDRPTIKIRSQALKDNPALREHNEKHEKSVGELLVEKFLIKDKKLEAAERQLRMFHQVSLDREKKKEEEEEGVEGDTKVQSKITRRFTRRRSSADIQLDPEQLEREVAYAQVQAKVLDSLVAEEQANIENEVRRGTLIRKGTIGGPRTVPSFFSNNFDGDSVSQEEEDAAALRMKRTTKKTKKKKKTTDKPSPPLPPGEEGEEGDSRDSRRSSSSSDVSVSFLKDKEKIEGEKRDAEETETISKPKMYKIEACNSAGDFSTLWLNKSPTESNEMTIEQFRESVRISVPKKLVEKHETVEKIDEEPETEVVLPVRKTYVKDTSRNSVYFTVKAPVESAKQEKDDSKDRKSTRDVERENGAIQADLTSKIDGKETEVSRRIQGRQRSEVEVVEEKLEDRELLTDGSKVPGAREGRSVVSVGLDTADGSSAGPVRLPKPSKINLDENNAVEAPELSSAYLAKRRRRDEAHGDSLPGKTSSAATLGSTTPEGKSDDLAEEPTCIEGKENAVEVVGKEIGQGEIGGRRTKTTTLSTGLKIEGKRNEQETRRKEEGKSKLVEEDKDTGGKIEKSKEPKCLEGKENLVEVVAKETGQGEIGGKRTKTTLSTGLKIEGRRNEQETRRKEEGRSKLVEEDKDTGGKIEKSKDPKCLEGKENLVEVVAKETGQGEIGGKRTKTTLSTGLKIEGRRNEQETRRKEEGKSKLVEEDKDTGGKIEKSKEPKCLEGKENLVEVVAKETGQGEIGGKRTKTTLSTGLKIEGRNEQKEEGNKSKVDGILKKATSRSDKLEEAEGKSVEKEIEEDGKSRRIDGATKKRTTLERGLRNEGRRIEEEVEKTIDTGERGKAADTRSGKVSRDAGLTKFTKKEEDKIGGAEPKFPRRTGAPTPQKGELNEPSDSPKSPKSDTEPPKTSTKTLESPTTPKIDTEKSTETKVPWRSKIAQKSNAEVPKTPRTVSTVKEEEKVGGAEPKVPRKTTGSLIPVKNDSEKSRDAELPKETTSSKPVKIDVDKTAPESPKTPSKNVDSPNTPKIETEKVADPKFPWKSKIVPKVSSEATKASKESTSGKTSSPATKESILPRALNKSVSVDSQKKQTTDSPPGKIVEHSISLDETPSTRKMTVDGATESQKLQNTMQRENTRIEGTEEVESGGLSKSTSTESIDFWSQIKAPDSPVASKIKGPPNFGSSGAAGKQQASSFAEPRSIQEIREKKSETEVKVSGSVVGGPAEEAVDQETRKNLEARDKTERKDVPTKKEPKKKKNNLVISIAPSTTDVYSTVKKTPFNREDSTSTIVGSTSTTPDTSVPASEVSTPIVELSVPLINIVAAPPTPSRTENAEEEAEDASTPTNEITEPGLTKISKWSNRNDLSNVEDVTPVPSNDASLTGSPDGSPNGSTGVSPESSKKKRVVKKKKSSTTKKPSTTKKSSKKLDKETKESRKESSRNGETSLKPPERKFSPRTSPRNTPTQRPIDLIRMFYTTPSALLTATPRDLSKVRRAKIKRKKHQSRTPSVSSDSTGSTTSTATTESTDGSGSTCTELDDDAEHKRMNSTRSNDSGFDGSPRISNCDMACHKKCEKLTGNLCGLNQKLVVEALQSLKRAPSQSLDNQRNSDSSDHFPSGRITPPATNLPRFKKYAVTDFNFLKVLGKGSFGKVLLAELRGTECVYAVKCLKKDVVLEDDDVECTLIERKVLTLATRHPYLCHLFCTFQTESHLFFVMEYLNGGDLMFHIQKSGRFPEARARFYAAEIWSGLNFLHKKGIVYRDLKLDNVLLDFEGHIRIADFGMCKLQIFLDRTADTFCGTPDYMAPEIIKGLKYNQAVDWWSYGVLLYEMLTGQSPFSGCDEDELFWSICNERPFIPRYLSQEATDMLVCLLEKDSGKRLPGHEIAMHAFFQSLPWDRLERRQLEAPFKPALDHTLDTKYFDTAFTAERPRLTPVPDQILTSMDQGVFRGFSYTNPNATD